MPGSILLESPVVATLLAIIASGVGATVIGVFKALSRISELERDYKEINKVVSDLKQDMEVIKWGAVAGAQIRVQQIPLESGEQS